MTLTVESPRFGRVEIDPSTVIEFPEGLIGLEGRRFALLTSQPGSPLMWLHCIDNPSLSLPVTEPHRFFSQFSVELTDEDIERIGYDGQTAVDVYVTVVAASALEDFTANQKAPILIRDGRGHQVINQVASAELLAPLFAEALGSESAA
jgi:flagellar assembly factor FliW